MSHDIGHRGGEWYADVPRSIRTQALAGVLLILVAFGGFGLWSFRAPLAAAVIAQGSFVATGKNKVVQHLEGGIIDEILVSEGDRIGLGQSIVHLDETAARAKDRELFLRRARLEAVNARLLAEYAQKDAIAFPDVLASRRADPEIAAIMDNQMLNFAVSRSKLRGDIALLHNNVEALEIRAEGYRLQRVALEIQSVILAEDLTIKEDLRESGLMRQPEVNALRRAIADATGQTGRVTAEIAEARQMIAKHRTEIEQTNRAYAQAALDAMQSIQAELDSVREQSRNSENVLRRASIVAPVSGTIVRMYYHTPGGVIESGKPIAEILPADAQLIIEAQVPRIEIDSVRLGQTATVRLTALNRRTTPVLEGKVIYVSADSLPDTTQGAAREIYLARIEVPGSEFARIENFAPTPGMPAEILIATATRTFFDYLTRPITDSMSRAFRER